MEDVIASFGKALERINDIEKTIDTKLDTKFDEVLACQPQPLGGSSAPSQQLLEHTVCYTSAKKYILPHTQDHVAANRLRDRVYH